MGVSLVYSGGSGGLQGAWGAGTRLGVGEAFGTSPAEWVWGE